MLKKEIEWVSGWLFSMSIIFLGTAACGLVAMQFAPATIVNDKGELTPWPYIGAVPLTPHQLYWLGFGCAFGSLITCFWACNLMRAVLQSASESNAELRRYLEQNRPYPRTPSNQADRRNRE